jgi:hypothetical protein
MNAYKKYITLEDPKQLILSDLPFQPGQRVEIIILAEDNPRTPLVERLQTLLKQTQALHADNPMTEAEIAAEIEAYRQGNVETRHGASLQY